MGKILYLLKGMELQSLSSNRLLQELLKKYIKCSEGLVLFVSSAFYCHQQRRYWSAVIPP